MQVKKLRPKFELHGIAHCYHPDDILKLLDETKRHAAVVQYIPDGYVDLLALCIRTKCPIDVIQELAACGEIKTLCTDRSDCGFRSVYADPEEVWDAVPTESWSGVTKKELKELLRINASTIKLLVEENILEIKIIERSHHRRALGIVSINSLKQFVRDYVTVGLIAVDEGIQSQAVSRKLQDLALQPVTESPRFSLIYKRSDVVESGYIVSSAGQQFQAMVTRLQTELRDPAQCYQLPFETMGAGS
ncbi:MAG: hypothetical protein AAFN76_13325 [Pseudomonadota bacterium]